MVKPESNKKDSDESPLVQKRETVILHTSNVPQFGVGRVEPEKEKEKLSDKRDRKRKSEDDESPLFPKRKSVIVHTSNVPQIEAYPCIGLGCEKRFEHKKELEKHMLTNHKCEHCNITCDNATNFNMHIEKDTFCLEFYLKKRHERKENMKDIV